MYQPNGIVCQVNFTQVYIYLHIACVKNKQPVKRSLDYVGWKVDPEITKPKFGPSNQAYCHLTAYFNQWSFVLCMPRDRSLCNQVTNGFQPIMKPLASCHQNCNLSSRIFKCVGCSCKLSIPLFVAITFISKTAQYK